MLDERGVEYTERDMFGKHVFHWGIPAVSGAMFTDGGEWTELVVENATPEQAIEATLGSAELRKERDALDHLTDVLNATNDGLLAENAKLRELATLNWEWAHSCCGTSCRLQTNGCGYGIDRECNYEREIYDRMRELGVDA